MIHTCSRDVTRVNVNKPRDEKVCRTMCHDTAFILVTNVPQITHGKENGDRNKRIEKTR